MSIQGILFYGLTAESNSRGWSNSHVGFIIGKELKSMKALIQPVPDTDTFLFSKTCRLALGSTEHPI